MKLLYLWVLNHRILKTQEFNFSGEYHFSFNYEENCLECRQNNQYPSKLYNSKNVELISYIIGDNGDGKTTLMKLLMEILPYKGGIGFNKEKNYLKVIYALKEDVGNNIFIYSTLDKLEIKTYNNIKLSNCSYNTIMRMKVNNRGFFSCQEMKDTVIIFHSNVMDRNRYNAQNIFFGVEDISFNGLLRKNLMSYTSDSGFNRRTELRILFDEDMAHQIKFISENSNKKLIEWISFVLPKKLYLIFTDEYEMLNSVYKYDNSTTQTDNESIYNKYNEEIKPTKNNLDLDNLRKILAHIYKEIMSKYKSLNSNQDPSEEFQFLLYKGILMSYLRAIFPQTVGNTEKIQLQHLYERLSGFISNSKPETCYNFVKRLIETVNIHSNGLSEAVKELKDFTVKMKEHGIEKEAYTFYFSTNSNEEFITKFYKYFRATSFFPDYLSFQWEGLSSGESNLLNLYSRIYSLREKIKDDKAIILMIDEADLSYHPNWQQNFMKSLISFLNQFFSKHHIQIIIATHSPIMLSDALKENVIFLKKNKMGEDLDNTFGANIYDLYRDGMFLRKDTFGIIGTYAQEKIKNVMDQLNNWQKGQRLEEMDEIKKFIACMGDPLIKSIMQNKLVMIEEEMDGNNKNNSRVSSLIKTLNELQPEERAEIIEGIKKD